MNDNNHDSNHLDARDQAFLSGYERSRQGASYRTTGPASIVGGPGASHGSQGGPVSAEYLQGQHQRQTRAEVSEWHDYSTGTARIINTGSGPINAESDPLGYLRAHGLAAIDADGDEVMPSAAQARGLVGAYLDRMQREAVSNGQGWGSVTYSDPNMPARTRTVSARRVV